MHISLFIFLKRKKPSTVVLFYNGRFQNVHKVKALKVYLQSPQGHCLCSPLVGAEPFTETSGFGQRPKFFYNTSYFICDLVHQMLFYYILSVFSVLYHGHFRQDICHFDLFLLLVFPLTIRSLPLKG